jgi:DNA polymerase-3 subunit alpha
MKIDKAGKTMAFFTLDDFSGSCECLMFSKTYEQFGRYIEEEECVFIIGRPESSGDAIKLHIEKVIPLADVRNELTASVRIAIDTNKNKIECISELKNILEKNSGKFPVYIKLGENGSKGTLFEIDSYRVNASDEFISSVNNILGEDSVSLFCKK